MKSTLRLIAGLVAVLGTGVAIAQDIKVGVTLSATGPAASLGIPGAQHVCAAAANHRRKEGQLHRARRRIRHDHRGAQRAQADQRRQGRRADRLDGHAELARDDRRCRRKRNADDLDGGVGRIVEPVDAKRRWVFKTPQNDQQMALVIVGAHAGQRASRRSASSASPTPTAKAGGREFSKIGRDARR